MLREMAERYGGEAPAGAAAPNPVISVMLRHRSVRSYAERELPEGLLETLIAAGQSAATSSNMQTVSVVAVRDPATRTALSRAASGQAFVAQALVVLCFVADLSRAARVGEATGADLFALPMLDSFLASCNDCAIFAQNVALAAEAEGLGTCYVGNLRNDPEHIAGLLDLPPGAVALFGLCLGYETGQPTGVRPRLPQAVVLHRERYSTEGEAEALARYDRTFRDHEVAQGRPVGSWTGRHAARLGSRAYLAGREHMRAVLNRLGFPLT
ncbi:putative nitroreductase [Salipiger mucosus DSM 16094]|uniref:Putative nitroreductase n=1 Tax=Salipiger mucosus DSM 16094 TaxID=1123237 RepID=S9QG05_9RHOB|nr:putative nitroreductase [Salipiger mucosus DSM 16094]